MESPSNKLPCQGVAPVAYVLLGLLALAVLLGFCLNGEWGAFLKASWEGAFMALLGILAYMGLESRIARAFAWLLLGVLIVRVCLRPCTRLGSKEN